MCVEETFGLDSLCCMQGHSQAEPEEEVDSFRMLEFFLQND